MGREAQASESGVKGPQLLRPQGPGDFSRGPSSSASYVCISGPQPSPRQPPKAPLQPHPALPPPLSPTDPGRHVGRNAVMSEAARHVPSPQTGPNNPCWRLQDSSWINCSWNGSRASLCPLPSRHQSRSRGAALPTPTCRHWGLEDNAETDT